MEYSTMCKTLEGKVAIVTGGARGIGKAICARLAAEGAKLAIVDILLETAQQTADEFTAAGFEAKAYAANVAKMEDAEATVNAVVSDFGKVDILVNNAGITKDTLMLKMTEDQWDAVIDNNLKSVFNTIRAVTPLMMRQRSGSIINMSSIVGLMGNVGQANYAASKAGLIGLTKSVAKELGARGVRCNAIAPGFIATEMTNELSEEAKKAWMNMVPMRRVGEADEVAQVALFLGSSMSSYVTGQVISCCGGVSI